MVSIINATKMKKVIINYFYSLSKLHTSIIVSLVSFLLFSSGISSSSIYILDESKNAQCAWEMLNDNHMIIPTFNGELRTDKPPLHYYFMMIGYKIFGKTALGARFFSAITGSLFMLLFFLFILRHSSKQHAWWTMFVLWSSIHFVLEFHLAVPDPYLITCIGLTLIYFYEAVEKSNIKNTILMYVFMGLGVLAKGPIAILLPGLVMLIYLIASKNLNLKTIRKLYPLLGIFIVSTIAVPWYYQVYKKTEGVWLHGFLFDHNINRFDSTKEGHGGFFLITLLYYFLGFIPYIFFIAPLIKHLKYIRNNKLLLFSAITSLCFILFFTISSTKLPNYAMPAYPFTALLFASFITEYLLQYKDKNFIGNFIAIFIFSILIIISVGIGIHLDPNLKGMYHLLGFLVLLPIGSLIAIKYAMKYKLRQSLFSLATTFGITSIIIMTLFFPAIVKKNPITQSKHLISGANRVAYYHNINPAYIFEYGKVKKLTSPEEITNFLHHPKNVLITTKKDLETLKIDISITVLFQCTDLFDNRKTRIVKKDIETRDKR